MTDKTCTTCGRAISMERSLPDNVYWESRASDNVFCKAIGIMMAAADLDPLCQGRFWIEKQEERTCHLSEKHPAHSFDGQARDCLECGYEFDCDCGEDERFYCCPGCGAKVVDQ